MVKNAAEIKVLPDSGGAEGNLRRPQRSDGNLGTREPRFPRDRGGRTVAAHEKTVVFVETV